ARVIHRSGKGIGGLRTETARESFDRTQLKRVVEGLRVGHALPDSDEVAIPPSSLWLENLVTVHDSPRRKVDVADTDQVIAARTRIADSDGPIPGELPLDAEVVLHDIWRLEIKTGHLQLRFHRCHIEIRHYVRERRVGERRSCRKRGIQAAGKEIVLR